MGFFLHHGAGCWLERDIIIGMALFLRPEDEVRGVFFFEASSAWQPQL